MLHMKCLVSIIVFACFNVYIYYLIDNFVNNNRTHIIIHYHFLTI